MQKLKTELKNFWQLKKTFLLIFAILFIACLAIFRANFFYIDDMGRAMEGYRGWKNFSRFTSDIASVPIHTSSYLGDIAPLSQIIALVSLALTCCILLYVFVIKIYHKKINFFHIAAVIILAISPYFLECLSYRFDSPYMALSILVSVLPLFFLDFPKPWFYISIFLSTLIMCTSYQASSGIFPMAIILVGFANFIRGSKLKEVIALLAKSALAYAAGILFFRFVLMIPTPEGDYVSSSILPFGELISGTFTHLADFYNLVFSDFRWLWLVLADLIALAFIVLPIFKTKQHKAATIIITIFTLALCLALAFGLYPLLEFPLTAPRAMYGFGVLLALLALQVSCLADRAFAKLPAIALAYCFIAFAFIYGNALDRQHQWAKFRVETLISDIKNLDALTAHDSTNLLITHNISFAPSIENYLAHSDAKILERLIPNQFSGGWFWGPYPLNYYNLGNINYLYDTENVDTAEYEKVVSNNYHDVYAKDNNIVVTLK